MSFCLISDLVSAGVSVWDYSASFLSWFFGYAFIMINRSSWGNVV